MKIAKIAAITTLALAAGALQLGATTALAGPPDERELIQMIEKAGMMRKDGMVTKQDFIKLMDSIGMAVVFAILLIAANSMMLAARERVNEVGILKTVGFTDRLLFGLVIAEASVIAFTGAIVGLGAAKAFYRPSGFSALGFLPGFDVTVGTLATGVGIAVALALASGLVPAMQAARLSAVQALRHVE